MAKIQLRRGTTSQWVSANTVLAKGEPGWDESTGEFKIGDGVKTWNTLPIALSGIYTTEEFVSAQVPQMIATQVPPLISAQVSPLVTDALASEGILTAIEDFSLASDEVGWKVEGDADYRIVSSASDGITSPVGGSSFVKLPEETGWSWAIMGTNRRVFVGQRTDGTLYGMYEPPIELPDKLVIVGDSLSAGWLQYLPGLIASLGGREVTTIGIGGQTSPQIAARQGGKPALLTVSGNTIPASGSVAVTAWSTNLLQITSDGTRSIVGQLCGIPGTLTATRTAGPTYSYTFSRTAAGVATPCPASSPFQCGHGDIGKIPIICIGRNNISDTPESIVAQAKAIFDYSGTGKGLVLSIPPKDVEINTPTSDRAKVDAINTALRDAFSPYWVDWAAYLRSSDTLASVGITATATDLQNISDGVTPLSFRSDELHLNAKAYEAATNLISQHIISKGW